MVQPMQAKTTSAPRRSEAYWRHRCAVITTQFLPPVLPQTGYPKHGYGSAAEYVIEKIRDATGPWRVSFRNHLLNILSHDGPVGAQGFVDCVITTLNTGAHVDRQTLVSYLAPELNAALTGGTVQTPQLPALPPAPTFQPAPSLPHDDGSGWHEEPDPGWQHDDGQQPPPLPGDEEEIAPQGPEPPDDITPLPGYTPDGVFLPVPSDSYVQPPPGPQQSYVPEQAQLPGTLTTTNVAVFLVALAAAGAVGWAIGRSMR